MSVVIDTFEYHYNYSSLTLKIIQNDKYYDIILQTNASYYYCINDCGSRRCHCKDKDWAQGSWGGELLTYNSDKTFSENLYNFLKENAFDIISLDRQKLFKWFYDNEYNYLKKYYSNKINYILSYIRSLQKIGIFSKEFYDLVKEQFKENNIHILKLVIREEYNSDLNKYMIFIDDIYILNIDYYYHSEIPSLTELSYFKIKEIFRQTEVLDFLYNEIVENNLNEVNVDDISYKQLFKCINIISQYNQISEYKTNYELYLKKPYYTEIEKDIGDIYDIYDILDELNDIKEIWKSMEHNFNLY